MVSKKPAPMINTRKEPDEDYLFFDVTPCNLPYVADVSEKRATSSFRVA
jgi:hypothetical protein